MGKRFSFLQTVKNRSGTGVSSFVCKVVKAPSSVEGKSCTSTFFLWWRAPQQMLRTHRSLEAYCATVWWWWWRWIVFFCLVMEYRWNEIDRRNRSNRGKTCPSATLSITNPTWTDPGSNPGLRVYFHFLRKLISNPPHKDNVTFTMRFLRKLMRSYIAEIRSLLDWYDINLKIARKFTMLTLSTNFNRNPLVTFLYLVHNAT